MLIVSFLLVLLARRGLSSLPTQPYTDLQREVAQFESYPDHVT
jgi:hypothetical protein